MLMKVIYSLFMILKSIIVLISNIDQKKVVQYAIILVTSV